MSELHPIAQASPGSCCTHMKFFVQRQWRLVRLQGFSRTVSLQNQVGGSPRVSPDALALTAGIQWLTNGLHSRPDDGSAARDVMCTVLPLTEDYEHAMLDIRPRRENIQPGDGLPFSAYGAYFFRTIIWPPMADIPRMERGPSVMRQSSIKYVFGKDFDTLQRKYRPLLYIPKSMVPKARVGTQKSFSKRHRVDEPAPAAILENFEIYLGDGHYDAGEDLPWDERVDYPEERQDDPAVQLTRLWNQFCSDVLQKCGNLKGEPLAASHCRLSMEERLHVTDDVYKDMNLAMVFHRVQCMKVSGKEWMDAFNLYFPSFKGPPGRQPQNYPRMKYWEEWCDLKLKLSGKDFDTVRRKFWELFKTLLWIAKPSKTRVWNYEVDLNFRKFPVNYNGRAPQVIVSPSAHPARWEPERVPGGDAEGEEEEEASEDENGGEPEVDRRQWVNGIAPIPDRILLRQEEEESGSEIDV